MRNTLHVCGVGMVLLWSLACGMAGDSPASRQLQQLFDDHWEFRLQEDPLFATEVGDHRYDDRLPSVAPADFERRLLEERRFLQRLHGIPRYVLSDEEKTSYDIFERLEENQVAEYELRSHLMPITNRTGFHVSFPQLPERMPLRTLQDYENYLSRLRAFRTYAEEHIALMRQGLEEGYVLPSIVLEGIDEVLAAQILDDAEQSRLYGPFREFPETMSQEQRERLAAAGREAISGSVVPGYRQFLIFMTEEYLPRGRDSIAASDLPQGRAFYQHRVQRFTTLATTPEEVHQRGLAEVERIRGEMQAVLEELGFEGSFEEFLTFLRSDPRFYAETPEELLKGVALVLKRIDGKLPGLFGKLPRMPYGIKPVPDYIAPKTTTAYYERPTGDGTVAGTYYVNTYDLDSRPLYEIEALSLHEAVPGHHLQIALQQELEGLPAFRRFAGFTVFVEGWALYAERLGLEAGFYQDPYSNFGRLTYEMWRACRLVVDTGIHHLGWSRQQAIDFMARNSALSLHNITTEVDRYIAWPGQALAYKTGELKIRELRRQAEAELGERFDLRDFHDVVLGSGAVPLDVLERQVEGYVKSVQEGGRGSEGPNQ